MAYSIGEAASMTGIAISTLRYYDREGMFPEMARSEGGIRIFSDKELGTIRVIECLKTAGMSIKEIKEFLHWCEEGDASLSKRQAMFHERRQAVEKQIEALQETLHTLDYKCWYYDTAVAAGTEEALRQLTDADIPEDVRPYKI